MNTLNYLWAIEFLSLDAVVPHYEGLWLGSISPSRLRVTARRAIEPFLGDEKEPEFINFRTERIVHDWIRAMESNDRQLLLKVDRWIRYVHRDIRNPRPESKWADLMDALHHGRGSTSGLPPRLAMLIQRLVQEYEEEIGPSRKALEEPWLRGEAEDLSAWDKRLLLAAERETPVGAVGNHIFEILSANCLALLWRRLAGDLDDQEIAALHAWGQETMMLRQIPPHEVPYIWSWQYLVTDLIPGRLLEQRRGCG